MILEWPRKPQRGDLLELDIDTIDVSGVASADVNVLLGPQKAPRAYRISVRDALPGERVRLSVGLVTRDEITGAVVELLRPSPVRVAARCPHFGSHLLEGRGCGGCALQSMPYAEQLALKRQLVVDSLGSAMAQAAPTHTAPPVPPVLAQADPWHYRNKMEFSFAPGFEGTVRLGMYPAGVKRFIVDLSRCELLSDLAGPLLDAVRQWAMRNGVPPYRPHLDEGFLRTLTLREGARTGDRMVVLTTSPDDTVQTAAGPRSAASVVAELPEVVCEAARRHGGTVTSVIWVVQDAQRGKATQFVVTTLFGRDALRDELRLAEDHVLRFDIAPRAFFQPNTLQAEVLYRQVRGAACAPTGKTIDLSAAHAFDLYCGTGTIGLCLARAVGRVTGVELNEDAVDNAIANAAANGITNARFLAGDVGKVLAGPLAGVAPDIVVVDPPRAGLSAEALGHVVALRAPRLVYVSCNPAALGRDLATLLMAGYRVDHLQPVDMFPHTAHVETVVGLVR